MHVIIIVLFVSYNVHSMPTLTQTLLISNVRAVFYFKINCKYSVILLFFDSNSRRISLLRSHPLVRLALYPLLLNSNTYNYYDLGSLILASILEKTDAQHIVLHWNN